MTNSYKEDVIHKNLDIIEQLLRNVFNCGQISIEHQCTQRLKAEVDYRTAAIKSLSDEEIRLVAEDAYKKGYADALGKKPINLNVFARKEESPSD